MPVVFVLTPVIISTWPVLTGAVAGAAVALGLTVRATAKEEVQQAHETVENQVEVGLAETEVLSESLATEQEIVLTKGTVEVRVRRDARGRVTVRAAGHGHAQEELRALCEQFTMKLTQCLVYNRVMTELKAKGFQVMNEEKLQDETLRIHVRHWE